MAVTHSSMVFLWNDLGDQIVKLLIPGYRGEVTWDETSAWLAGPVAAAASRFRSQPGT